MIGAEPRTLTLTHRARPWTVNAERAGRLPGKGNQYQRRAAEVRVWREAFWGLALEAKAPKLHRVTIAAQARLRGDRSIDIDACFPALKAAIDGLVDARVIPDDCPPHIAWLRIDEPETGCPRDEFLLTIEEVPVA